MSSDDTLATATPGITSEVGRLRTVVLHRPGNELKRLTPRNNDRLLFDGLPWVSRAQEEHDAFAEALRGHDVEVLYLSDLVKEALAVPAARAQALEAVLDDPRLGQSLTDRVRSYLDELDEHSVTRQINAALDEGSASEEFNVAAVEAAHGFLNDPSDEW